MNNTATALIVKFVITFFAAAIAFMLLRNSGFTTTGNATWLWILIVGILATAANYFLGDLYVLPRYGNVVASIVDGIAAALVAYIIALIATPFDTTFASLTIFALLVAVAEYFFHRYLKQAEKVEP